MSSHHRFKLSHLMPNSWFYKLRDMKRHRPPNHRKCSETTRTSRRLNHYSHGTTTPKPLPLSPHRSCSYLNTQHMSLEKLHPSTLHLNPKASDIQFSRDHHRPRTSRESTMVIEGNHEFQDLQLRPIRTRPVLNGGTTRGTCPSSPRLRSRSLPAPSGGRFSTTSASGDRRSAARRSIAVVKASTDPPRDFRESMVEMIVENDVNAPADMQELLECYLSLNSREYHGLITAVFREVWLEIDETIYEN